ncbi:MAG: hypothetical protein APF81_26735 [Desulfosporosinus sp. BRH_c37]|nr:MAG: hypothetical protein APF81_26735 [Desulfosporosinus sp. BRH_c37]
MRKKLFLVMFISILFTLNAKTVFAQTEVSGIISQDTTWDKSGSPYLFKGSVLITQGVTLNICPGAILNLGEYSLQINGKVLADGTKNDLIQINSNKLSSYNNVVINSDNNEFQYCNFFGNDIMYGYGILLEDSSNNQISNCSLNTFMNGIRISNSYNNKISNCDISNCLVGVEVSNGNFDIDHCKITNNVGRAGIDIDSLFSSSNVSNSLIKDNVNGIYINPTGKIFIKNCDIYNNKNFNIQPNYSTNVIDATNNYWGTTDEARIQEGIHDYYDDFKLPKINYQPYSTEPNVQDIVPITLQSIAITTPATKLNYTVGDSLDISGLIVTGTYSNGSTKVEPITTANVTGFDSLKPTTDQVLTITFDDKTTTYKVKIVNQTTTDQTYMEWPAKTNANGAFLTIKFSLPISPYTINTDNIYIVDSNGQKLKNAILVLGADGKSVKVEHNCKLGETYTLYILKNVASNSNEHLENSIKMQFTINPS